MALDALRESGSMTREGIESSPGPIPMVARIGGAGDGSQVRRAVTVGVVKVSTIQDCPTAKRYALSF